MLLKSPYSGLDLVLVLGHTAEVLTKIYKVSKAYPNGVRGRGPTARDARYWGT